jgi:hypothetical protein
MTRKNFLVHYTAFVKFALKLAKVARESGIETLERVSEFIEKNLRAWLKNIGVKTTYIEPGSPCGKMAYTL